MSFYDDGEWFRFPRKFLLVMSPRDAVLLSLIFNIANMKHKKGEEKNGWFSLSNKRIRNNIYYTDVQIKSSIKSLNDKGILSVERKGVHGRRFIYVNIDLLEELVTEYKNVLSTKMYSEKNKNVLSTEYKNVLGQEGTRTIKKELNKERSTSVEHPANTFPNNNTPQKTDERRWTRYAKKLSDAISTFRKVNSKSKLRSWGQSIKQLHTIEKIEIKRLKRVLLWYCKTITGGVPEFIPEAFSGAAFREKFLRIESAMQRENPTPNRFRHEVERIDLGNGHFKVRFTPIRGNE
ncbi:MAG: hypothetical protein DRN14_00185 [Thermoplasmata archaeon]|nr:MAG: hypothetical protein DRN14_00185 [Thermoplasmata archaeon]